MASKRAMLLLAILDAALCLAPAVSADASQVVASEVVFKAGPNQKLGPKIAYPGGVKPACAGWSTAVSGTLTTLRCTLGPAPTFSAGDILQVKYTCNKPVVACGASTPKGALAASSVIGLGSIVPTNDAYSCVYTFTNLLNAVIQDNLFVSLTC